MDYDNSTFIPITILIVDDDSFFRFLRRKTEALVRLRSTFAVDRVLGFHCDGDDDNDDNDGDDDDSRV